MNLATTPSNLFLHAPQPHKFFVFQEYADNLKESGVHGAVLVLEPTFNSDALANALGIPPAKSYVRRHLSTELDTIVKPAR